MKKLFLRSVAIAAILTAAIVLLVWYWTMKREVPAQARVIPADAFAVLTLNVRELAANLPGNNHLFPEMADRSILEDELAPVARAITGNNEETGIAVTADILLFIYQTGEEGYLGAAVALTDSAAFGSLVRVHLAKEFNIIPLSMGGIPLMQFDTTAAVFGWTDDVALFLYPLGKQNIPQLTAQCTQLLKQQKENSVMTNEKFREMEEQAFAIGLWLQTKPMISFTGGGSLMETIADDVETYSYFANFEDGEILIRSEWHLPDDTKRNMIKEFEFPCDTSHITSFLRGRFNVQPVYIPEYSNANIALHNLPIAEDEYPELLSSFTGDFISIGHSNIDSIRGLETHCFLLSDPVQAKSFITGRMQRDSIPLTAGGWKYTVSDVHEWRMIIDNDMLTITNHKDVDGRPHPVPPGLTGYMAWYNFEKIFADMKSGDSPYMSLVNAAAPLLSEHVTTCSSTLPVQFGNVRHSEIVFRFRNREVNALVQTEELIRKIYFGK
jgi:hypothetical protein